MAGRRPKPTHLKVVTGNPGKRKLNDKEPQPAKKSPARQHILATGEKLRGAGSQFYLMAWVFLQLPIHWRWSVFAISMQISFSFA